MKNAIVICVCMAYAGFSSAVIIGNERAAGTLNTHEDIDYMLLNLTSISERELEDFFQGKTVNLVLECPEGVALPFNLSLNGEFLALEPTGEKPYSLKILKTCFIRHYKDVFLFSDDCVNWKEFQDFFTGSIGLRFYTEEDGLELTVKADKKVGVLADKKGL